MKTNNDLTCDLCGSTFERGFFCTGKLWCAECFAGQRPAVAMPPTAREEELIAEWIRPQTTAEVRT